MASAYNKVPRHAVVAVAEGTSRPLLRRETLDDLARLEVG
jgi:diaminopimelate decarboxylase